jgi:regulatory protein
MNEVEPFQRARFAAMRFLSYRPRSEGEIRARLRRRFSDAMVEEVIQSLKDDSLVDDASFARAWRHSRETHRPRSAQSVKRELLQKGVEAGIAQDAVRDMDDEDAAYRAGSKAARTAADAEFPAFRRRLWGYLQRRGFSQSVARRTIDRLWNERPEGPPP